MQRIDRRFGNSHWAIKRGSNCHRHTLRGACALVYTEPAYEPALGYARYTAAVNVSDRDPTYNDVAPRANQRFWTPTYGQRGMCAQIAIVWRCSAVAAAAILVNEIQKMPLLSLYSAISLLDERCRRTDSKRVLATQRLMFDSRRKGTATLSKDRGALRPT